MCKLSYTARPNIRVCELFADGGLRMVMLSPAVQMPALAAGRSRVTGITAAALQPTIQNIAGYRWPQANTYVTHLQPTGCICSRCRCIVTCFPRFTVQKIYVCYMMAVYMYLCTVECC